jgi:AraC-like DNA-binding protein
MTVRAQSIPTRHYFPEHAHRWHQVVYAISGVLTVAVEGRSFVISPEQAMRVGSLFGAEFRSLWIADEAGRGLPGSPTVFGVSPLLRALIVEAAEIEGQEDRDGYAGRVTGLGSETWGRELGMSGRTLARRFEAELGMSLRSWRRRLRLFKAIELLGGGLGVTRTAMELGYGSTSAFVYAFRTDMGCSPQAYMRGRVATSGRAA